MRAIVGRFATPVCPIVGRPDNLQRLIKVGIFQQEMLPYETFIYSKASSAVFAFVVGMLLKP